MVYPIIKKFKEYQVMSKKSDVNKLGLTQLTVLTAVNMMGSGIIMLPTKLASIGTMSVLSWLVTAVGSLCLAYAFAKCGMFSRKPGGMGGYAEYAFGKSGNFMANFTYAISLVIANIAISISAVGYGSVLFGWHPGPLMICAATIIIIWITTVCNFGGPRITGRIGAVTVWGVIIPVVIISVVGWAWFSPHLYASSWNPHHVPFISGLTTSIAMTLWSFLGLESACANSEAVENPERNVPIAVFGGTLLCAVFYIASTNVMAGFVPNAELANSNAPFGLAFSYMFTPAIGKLVMFLMVIACIGSLLGWQFTVAQVFKSASDIGYFPKIFGKVTAKNAPVIGMIILGIIQTILALMTISPTLNEQFNNLVDLAVVTNIIPYILSMAALIPLQRLYKTNNITHVAIYATAIIGTIYSFYALYSCGSNAMLTGSLVAFAGWSFYGIFVRDSNTCAQK